MHVVAMAESIARRHHRPPHHRGWFSRLRAVRVAAVVVILSFARIVIDAVVYPVGLHALCRPSGCVATSACVRPNRALTTSRVSAVSKDFFTTADHRQMMKTTRMFIDVAVDTTTSHHRRQMEELVATVRVLMPHVRVFQAIIGWPVGVVWPL